MSNSDHLELEDLFGRQVQVETDFALLSYYWLPRVLHSEVVSCGAAPIHFGISSDTGVVQSCSGKHIVECSYAYFPCSALRGKYSSICAGPLILKIFILSLLRCSLTFRYNDCIADIST